MPMDRDEFHIKQMDPNELKNWMARNNRKNNTDNLQARPNKQEQHLWTKKNKHRTRKICIENSAICRASKEIKTKHKRETCPEGHQNKTEKPFQKQN